MQGLKSKYQCAFIEGRALIESLVSNGLQPGRAGVVAFACGVSRTVVLNVHCSSIIPRLTAVALIEQPVGKWAAPAAGPLVEAPDCPLLAASEGDSLVLAVWLAELSSDGLVLRLSEPLAGMVRSVPGKLRWRYDADIGEEVHCLGSARELQTAFASLERPMSLEKELCRGSAFGVSPDLLDHGGVSIRATNPQIGRCVLTLVESLPPQLAVSLRRGLVQPGAIQC